MSFFKILNEKSQHLQFSDLKGQLQLLHRRISHINTVLSANKKDCESTTDRL